MDRFVPSASDQHRSATPPLRMLPHLTVSNPVVEEELAERLSDLTGCTVDLAEIVP